MSYGSNNRVRAERYGNRRILAKVPYWGGKGTEMAKEIPGVSPAWDNSGEKRKWIGWSYPLNIQVCRRMREVFGDRLDIGPELHEWATAELVLEKAQLGLRFASVAELPDGFAEKAPLLAKAFETRPFQAVGVRFIYEGNRVILADEPGLGKTLQTLGGLEAAAAIRVVVFCRKTAMRLVWEREALRWLPGTQVFVCDGTKRARQATIAAFNEAATDQSENMCILVCNTEMVRMKVQYVDGKRFETADYPELFEQQWHAVVVDESHNSLIGKSHLAKATSSGKQKISQTRLGMYRLPVADGGQKVALSGTPFRGKIINIWGTLNWLRPDIFTSYWNFAKMYFTIEEGSYGMIVDGENLRPDAVEAFDIMLAPYSLRRTKAEVAKDLPPKIYPGTPLDPADPDSPSGIWVELESQQRRAYDAIQDNGLIRLDGAEDGDEAGGKLVINGVLAEVTRRRQFATSYGRIVNGEFQPKLPSSKFDWIVDFLDSMQGNESKVIIASQFTKVINLFAEELKERGHRSFVLTGDTKQSEREEIVRNFQNPRNPVRVVLLNSKAGGESITLDSADYVILIDEADNPDVQIQLEDRAHRVSRSGDRLPVTVYYLRALGTIEQSIAVTCGARQGACARSLDGSRGVEILRRNSAGKA